MENRNDNKPFLILCISGRLGRLVSNTLNSPLFPSPLHHRFHWVRPRQISPPASATHFMLFASASSPSLPRSWGLVFAHGSLAVHLEQLLSRLLWLQIDRERPARAGLAFCLLPEGASAWPAAKRRMYCQLGCRAHARAGPLQGYYHVRSNGIAVAEPIWCFHQPLYQINVH